MCSQPTYQRQSSFFPNLFHHICILLWTFHEGQLPRFPQRWEQPKPHICCQATCANWEFVCCLVICCLVWAACLFLWAGCEVPLIEIWLKDAFVTLWPYRNYRCLWKIPPGGKMAKPRSSSRSCVSSGSVDKVGNCMHNKYKQVQVHQSGGLMNSNPRWCIKDILASMPLIFQWWRCSS